MQLLSKVDNALRLFEATRGMHCQRDIIINNGVRCEFGDPFPTRPLLNFMNKGAR